MGRRPSLARRPYIVVDLFCGAGGFSTGLKRAMERAHRRVEILAINHWDDAINSHTLNHPDVHHLQEDLGTIDPRRALTEAKMGLTIDLLLAAPECTSHSYSRGDKPIDDQSRATAYHVMRWIDQANVKAFIIENVPAFRAWGPSDRNGKADKKRRGTIYPAYLDMLRSFGYHVEARVLNAADYGGATTRKRLFIIGVKIGSKKRLVPWPEATHAKDPRLLGLKKWRGAWEIIDKSLEGRSIFRRMFEGDPLAYNTMQRILVGGDKFWPALRPWLTILRNHMAAQSIDGPVPTLAANGQHIGVADPVIVKVSHKGGNGTYARSAHEPLFTLTTMNGEQCVADPIVVEMRNGKYASPMTDPLSTITTMGAHHAVADPVVVTVAHGSGNGRGNAGRVRGAREPLGTIPGSNTFGVADAMLVNVAHGDMSGRVTPAAAPAPTLTGSREIGVAEALIIGQQSNAVARPDSEPAPTIATAGKIAHVEPIIVSAGGTWEDRPQSVDDPLRTVMPTAAKCLTEPVVIVQRSNNAPHSVTEPVPCLNTGGHIAVAQAFVLQQQSGGVPREVAEPLPTIATDGAISLVEPVEQVIIPFNGEREGQEPRSHSSAEPLPCVTTGGAGQKGLATALLKYNRTGGLRSPDAPLDTLTGKPPYGVVEPEVDALMDEEPVGAITPFGIKIGLGLYLDIRFRMLKVHELKGAMGFPKEYQLKGTIDDQVKQIGNAVSVEMAEALCFAVLGGGPR